MNWTTERKQQLRQAWNEGLSVTLIGHRMGVTRGMVSGQVRLMKLPKRSPERHPGDSRKHKVFATKPVPSMPPGVTPPTIWKTLIDLAHDECRWPFGDRHFVFCAMLASPNLPYCACHARIAYRPGTLPHLALRRSLP